MQTLGTISESINETRHCTAASYTIRWDTGPRGVYLSTEPVFLADWQHQQVNRTAHPLFAGQLVAKAEASGGQRYAGSGREQQGGARPLVVTYTHAHTAN